VVAFVLEFIPVLGTIVSGVVCVLLAFTKGWLFALGMLIYFVGVHIFEGDIVGPRIVGKAVGLHPVISLFALLAGADLFGVWGAILASPIAGVVQALLIAFWQNWRENHPEQFPAEGAVSSVEKTAEEVGKKVAPIGEVLSSFLNPCLQRRSIAPTLRVRRHATTTESAPPSTRK